MNSLIDNLMQLAPEEGYNPTPLPGIGVFKASESSTRVPLCYSQGIIIVAQGNKRVYLEDQTYDYNPDNYLVLALPMPAECETIVEPGKPLLSLVVDIDMGQLNELVRLFGEHGEKYKSESKQSDNKGLFVSRCTEELSDHQIDNILR